MTRFGIAFYTGATALSMISASAFAASASATLNCQGEAGTILAGSWTLDAVADKTESYLANGLAVTHPGSSMDVTLTFDKNPERACFDFDLMFFDLLDGKEVANVDFVPVSEVIVAKGSFTQTYRLTIPSVLGVGAYALDVQLANTADGPRRIYSDKGGSGSIYFSWNPGQPGSPTYGSGEALGFVGYSDVKLPLGDGHALTFSIDPYRLEVMSTTMTALKGLTQEQRRSPTHVHSRLLSYQSNDRVLWGRWDGKAASGSEALSKLTALYDDSKKPWEWTSSTDILGKKAKYGQSWVFSCVTVSMARALGIPSRPVTNIDSVQEAGGSHRAAYRPTSSPMLVTTGSAVVFTTDDKGVTSFNAAKSADKVWNFHVWNEAYHKTDSGSSDWNAYDGTCQETSDGRAQCGPSSVSTLLKNGYDAAFVAGETNADTKVYLYK